MRAPPNISASDKKDSTMHTTAATVDLQRERERERGGGGGKRETTGHYQMQTSTFFLYAKDQGIWHS